MENRYSFSFKYHKFPWLVLDDEDEKIKERKRPSVVVLLKGNNDVELIEHFYLILARIAP